MNAVPPSRRPLAGSRLLALGPGLALALGVLALVFTWAASCCRAETSSASGAVAVTSVPCVISSPGTYYLASDLALQNGYYTTAVSITASNVTLDFNGHTLTELGGTGNWDYGVYVGGDHVRVRGGTIVGFVHGVVVAGSCNQLEDLSIDHCTSIGLRLEYTHLTARRCRITNTGGSTYGGIDPSAYAILAYGDDDRIEDCDIAGVTALAGGYPAGIAHVGNTGMDIGNRVSGCAFGLGIDNVSIKFRDNLCAPDVTSPYQGAPGWAHSGTDAGNNH